MNTEEKLKNLKLSNKYNKIFSELENAKNKLDNLKKTKSYNEFLNKIEKIENRISNIKSAAKYGIFLKNELEIAKNINLIEGENYIFDWNPIAQKSLKGDLIGLSRIKYLLGGLFFGFFTIVIALTIRKSKNN